MFAPLSWRNIHPKDSPLNRLLHASPTILFYADAPPTMLADLLLCQVALAETLSGLPILISSSGSIFYPQASITLDPKVHSGSDDLDYSFTNPSIDKLPKNESSPSLAKPQLQVPLSNTNAVQMAWALLAQHVCTRLTNLLVSAEQLRQLCRQRSFMQQQEQALKVDKPSSIGLESGVATHPTPMEAQLVGPLSPICLEAFTRKWQNRCLQVSFRSIISS
ncbi:unnamed protein product [Protopolystoma xenopodis]|uniref:Uncharacterized protein n=1 Tax=Protopolystoma xenopodis TaxID=117903 RepID=A0A3S5BU16_9PLAT|nr:unnamed protein product [Protopolystoma xenopodis]